MAKLNLVNPEELDPATGLPESIVNNSKYKNSTEDARILQDYLTTGKVPDVFGGSSISSTPTGIEASQIEPDLPFYGGDYNIEKAKEERAQEQSAGESLMHGAGRFITTVPTKALSGISSLGELIVNTGRAISEGSMNPYADTPVSDAVNKIEDGIKNSMPIYNTRADQSKNFLQRAFTDLDFWTNDMSDGAAFMASAWLTGWGGMKLLGPLTKAAYAAKLEQATAMGLEELSAAEAAGASAEQVNQIKFANGLREEALAAKKTNIDKLTMAGLSRTTESLMEGKQSYQTTYNDLINKTDENGNKKYSEDEAKNEAAKSAMLVSGLNMLLLPLDYDQYSGWFKTFSKSRDALFKVGAEGALESTIPSFGKALAKHAGRNIITEGVLEEGLQQAFQTYAQKKYNGDYNLDDIGPIVGSISEYLKGFTTKEGWDAMGAGMILGGLFGGITEAKGEAGKGAREKVNQLKTLMANNDYLKSNMASYVIKDEKTEKFTLNKAKIIADIIQQGQNGMFSKEMIKALGNNYEEAYKALDNMRFSNWAFSHFEAGMGEHLMDKIDDLGKLSVDELTAQGLLGHDMTNSKGKLVTPREISERYKQKAIELESLYNQTASRFDINSRAQHKNIFDEAVIQKETTKSLERINSKINTLKSEILNLNTNMEKGDTDLSTLEKPLPKSPQEKDLDQYNKRRQDLINTLKDSYERLDKLTNPKELKKQEEAAANAKKVDNAVNQASTKLKTQEDALKKVQDVEVAKFFTDHNGKIFKDVEFNGTKEDYVFARLKNGDIDPNNLVSLNSNRTVATKLLIPLIDLSKTSTETEYKNAKNIEARIEALDNLIKQDIKTGVQNVQAIKQLEDDLLDSLIQIEELQKYRKGKDSKFRRIGVTGSKVFTEQEYQKVIENANALKESYEQQLKDINNIQKELRENIKFLEEYQKYLLDPSITTEEKFKSLDTFEEGAIGDMIKYADKTSSEMEILSTEYTEKAKIVTDKISYLEKVIDAIQSILNRKKIERTLLHSEMADLRDYLDSMPGDLVDTLTDDEFRFLVLLKNKDKLDESQKTLLNERYQYFMQDHPNLAETIIQYGEKLKESKAKADILNSEIKDLNKQLILNKTEKEELEASLIDFTKIAEDSNKAFKDLTDVDILVRNLQRLKTTFSNLKVNLDKLAIKEKDLKAEANKKGGTNDYEPSNLTDEDFNNSDPGNTKRDFEDALNGTHGNNMMGETDVLTDDPDQLRWFSITEKVDPQKDFTLRAVSKKNNPFGEDVKFYDDSTILLVLHYDGNPVKIGNDLVYSTMGLTDSIKNKTLENKYTNKKEHSEKQINSMLANYETLRNRILTTEDPVFFKVTSKSAGIVIPSEPGPVVGRIVATNADLNNVDLNIVTSDTVEIAGRQFDNMSGKKGFVLIGHKGQIVKVTLPTMEELPGAIDFLMQQFEDLSEYFNKDQSKTGIAISNIKKLILFGNAKNSDFSKFRIYIDNKTQKFIFNGIEHSIKDFDRAELRKFLNTKLFNVDKLKLADNKAFVDPLSNKKYSSYKEYLMSTEGRNVENIPIKVRLPLLNEQQFKNVYLKFDYNNPLKDPKEEPEITLDEEEVSNATSFVEPTFTPTNVVNEAVSNTISNSESEEDEFSGLPPEIAEEAREAKKLGIMGGDKKAKPVSTEVTSTDADRERRRQKDRDRPARESVMYKLRNKIAGIDNPTPQNEIPTLSEAIKIAGAKLSSSIKINEGEITHVVFDQEESNFRFTYKGKQFAAFYTQNARGITRWEITKLNDKTGTYQVVSLDELKNINEKYGSQRDLLIGLGAKGLVEDIENFEKVEYSKEDKSSGNGIIPLENTVSAEQIRLGKKYEVTYTLEDFLKQYDTELAALEGKSAEDTALEKAKEALTKKSDTKPEVWNDEWNKLFEGESSASKETLDAEEKWFKQTFPQFAEDYERVIGIIKGGAIGRVTEAGKILISSLAVPGTTYHEAWHKVSLFLLTDSERQSLYNEYNKRTNQNLTGVNIEEAIAEEFRSYMLTGTSNIPFKESLFNKIIRLIKEFFIGKLENNPGTIEEIFSQIKKGKYANKNIVSRPTRAYNKSANMSVQFAEEANQVLTGALLNTIFRTNFNIDVLNNLHKLPLNKYYDQAFEDIKSYFGNWYNTSNASQEYKDSLLENTAILYNEVNRETFIKNHITYLAQFGLMVDTDENVTENADKDIETPETNNAPDWIESIKFSSKQGMSSAVKLLLLSLPELQTNVVNGKLVVSYKKSDYFGVPKIGNFENNVNYLQEKLSGLTTGEAMITKLQSLSESNPMIKDLLRKLKMSTEAFSTGLPLSEVLLQISFIQQFAKTKHEYKLNVINKETGEIYQIDSNTESLKNKMISIWKANSKQNLDSSKSLYKLKNGKYIFDAEKFNNLLTKFTSKGKSIKYDINNANQNIQLLAKLGISITKPVSSMSGEEKSIINRSLAKIKDFYINNKEANLEDMFTSDIVGSWISKLSVLELPYTNEAIELSHQNPEGETVYSITLNNYLSLITNKINNEGIDSLSHLKNDPYSANSIWKQMLTADKKAIKLVVIEGQTIKGIGETGEITSKLTAGDLIVTHFNSVMNNIYPLLRAGDKKIEYGFEINMDKHIDNYLNILKGYLKDELTRVINFREGKRSDINIFNKQANKLVTFYYLEENGIINPANVTKTNLQATLDNPKVNQAIEKYIQEQVTNTKELFIQNKLITVKNPTTYFNNGISTRLKSYSDITSSILNSTLDKVLKDFTVRYIMSNIEQTKIFLGDLAFFNHAKNEGPKRIGGTTGTKKISVSDRNLNAWLSQTPRADLKPVDGKINVGVFTDPLLTPDKFIENASKYLKIPINDPYFDVYKDIEIADAQGYITLPEYREFLIRSDMWSTKHEIAYPKVLKGEKLAYSEIQLFQPLKPQFYGPQQNGAGYTPLFLKFSLVPLLPSAIKNTKLENLNTLMMNNQVGILTFNTAAKVGPIINENLINEDGSINMDLNINVSNIDYSYFGIQLEISPEEKRKVTMGTQFRKLILTNLLPEGKSKIISVVDPNTDKLVKIETQELVNQWNNAIKDLTQLEINNILKKLQITEKGGGYIIDNPIKFKDLLLKEAHTRGASLNVRIGLEEALNLTSFNLDALANKTKIENILMSLINNTLIKQKTFGDMKVQMSGFGSASTEMLEDSNLKFYEVGKNGVRHIEVMLPHWFKEIYGRDIKIENIDPKLLNLVGYRIPTAEYAAMDVLVVKGFLPIESGNVIMVPAALPAKGGSDFDIDKMNLLIPNYEIFYDKSQALNYVNRRLVSFFDQNTSVELKDIEELDNIIAKEQQNPDSLTAKEKKAISLYYSYLREADYKLIYISSERNTKEAKQNKLIEISTQILTSPDNYKSLIRGNNAKTLQNLTEKITKLNKTEEKFNKKIGPLGRVLEFASNISTAISFWVGKDGVGIAAINNTHHTLSQQVNLYVPKNKTFEITLGLKEDTSEPFKKSAKLTAPVKINLLSNTDKDGNISFAHEYDANGLEGNKISDMISEFLNAYVDIAKDPFIFKLNAGTNTANVWFTLLRSGVPAENVAYFMAQPIIKDYLELKKFNKSQFLDDFSWKSEIIAEIAKKYNIKVSNFNKANEVSKIKTLDQLKNNINADITNVDFNTGVFLDYLVYENLSNDLSNIQKASTFDTSGVGKNRWHSRALLKNTEEALENTVFKNADKVINDTLVKPFYEVAKIAADLYNTGYTIDIDKASNLREQMFEETSSNTKTSAEQGKLLGYMENEFLIYLLSKYESNNKSLHSAISGIFTGEKSTAHKLNTFKQDPKLSNNLLIKELIPIINSNRGSTDNIKLFDSKFNSYQADLLLQAFEELFDYQDPKVRDFAKELMSLMILQGGPNLSPVTLYNLIPNSRFIKTFSKIVMEQFKTSDNDISSFIDEFYLNNWHKQDFVPYVSPKKIKDGNFIVLSKFATNSNKRYVRTSLKDKNGIKVIKLYQNTGIKGDSVIFKEVTKRGNGFYLREYYGDLRTSKIADNIISSKSEEQTSFIKEPSIIREEATQPATSESKPIIQPSTFKVIEISTSSYTKETPNDKSRGFFFTENLQAYLANRGRGADVRFDLAPSNVKLDVTATNNQAGIRQSNGVRNLNSFAIISKKYQQDGKGNFVKEEGQFKDTTEDFELFKKYNLEAINEALAYNKPLVIAEAGIATGKSALPLRFAEWLNNELKTKLGIQGIIKENTSTGYKGYGIFNLTKLTTQPSPGLQAVTKIVSTEITKESAVRQWALYGDKLISKFGKEIMKNWSKMSPEERAYKIKCL